ncbi:unnamed protein product [Cylindrotheca closterium]|uniref:Helicase-associated domain-containing protein n=1 Tax=Cylindrotheca closterium TaxID=2856 RepID=A0AAD2FL18_9STRA|nr:unnamed protein product [Cylindrotheca closterium]
MITKPGWNDRLQQLIAYYEEYGDCLVPIDYEEEKGLGKWVETQRRERRKQVQGKPSILNTTRIAELESLNFNWDLEEMERDEESSWGSALSEDELPREGLLGGEDYEVLWNTKFGELKKLMKADHPSGGFVLTNDCSPSLGGWILQQRHQYRMRQSGLESRLTEEKIQKLEGIGFEFENNHLSDGEGDESDGEGEETSDDEYESQSMEVEEESDLDKEEESNPIWENRFSMLESHMKKYYPKSRFPNGAYVAPSKCRRLLSSWVMNQRYHYRLKQTGRERTKKQRLSNAQIQKLESIGFLWEEESESEEGEEGTAAWENKFNMLEKHMKRHYPESRFPNGAYVAPSSCKKQLAGWVSNQRYFYRLKQRGVKVTKKQQLSDAQIRKLESIGFLWEVEEDSDSDKLKPLWEYKFNMLEKHMKRHYPESRFPNGAYVAASKCKKSLGCWVQSQRYRYRLRQTGRKLNKNQTLSDVQIRKLESIGFLWEDNDEVDEDSELDDEEKLNPAWESKFKMLEKHMKKQYPESRFPNGAYVAPSTCSNKPLARWVLTQRYHYRLKQAGRNLGKKQILSDAQIRSLESIGFLWEDHDAWKPNAEFGSEAESSSAAEESNDEVESESEGDSSSEAEDSKDESSSESESSEDDDEEDDAESEKAGRSTSRWDVKFNMLKEHMEKNYPKSQYPNGAYIAQSKCNKQLSCWVRSQRYYYRLRQNTGKLDIKSLRDDRVRKLESIGFLWEDNDDWRPEPESEGWNPPESESESEPETEVRPKPDLNQDKWDFNFDRLQKVMSRHYPNGGYVVKKACGGRRLFTWCGRQRYQYRRKQAGYETPMTDDRVAKLESIGFFWEEGQQPNRTNRNMMNPQREQKDHVSSPQVQKKANGDRYWEVWYGQYKRLVQHMRRNYPASKYPNGAYVTAAKCEKRLGTWVLHQRSQHRSKIAGQVCQLTDARIEHLERIGFLWEKEETDGTPRSQPNSRRVAQEPEISDSDGEEVSEDESSSESPEEESEEDRPEPSRRKSGQQRKLAHRSMGDTGNKGGTPLPGRSGQQRKLAHRSMGDTGNKGGTPLPGRVSDLLGLTKKEIIDRLKLAEEDKSTLESQLKKARSDVQATRFENKLLTDVTRDLKRGIDTVRESHTTAMMEERAQSVQESKRRKLAEDRLEKARQLIPPELYDESIFS